MFVKSILPLDVQLSSQAFGAANQAMTELFTAGCIGSTCVQKGYLDPDIVRSLSKTCFSILLPMFLSTSIMKTVQKYGLGITSLAVPVVAIVHCLTLYFISRNILLPLFDIDGQTVEGRATTVCCSFGNAGVVPLIFAEALFRNQGKDLLQKASSQISLYLLGWSPLFWSFGRNALLGDLMPNLPISDDALGGKPSILERMQSLKSLFPPPVVGVTIGLILSIPFLRNLIMNSSHDGITKQAPLGVVFNSCQNFGRAANPLALLVLTSSLALGKSRKVDVTNKNTEELAVPVLRRWCCVSIARFALSPSIMVFLLTLLEKGNLIGSINGEDAMTWFMLILAACMPSAQNSVIMLQVADQTDEASRLAKFLFSMYATSMIPVMLAATIMLDKCNFMTSL